MSVESTLNDIKELLAKQSRGGQGTSANVEISSASIEEANERVAQLRQEMQGLKDEITAAQAAGE